MDSGILLIRDLAVVMVIAGAIGWLCRRLGLSVIVGYLAAGVFIGPYTPPFALVSDLGRVQTLAQIGLVFLIFTIGMNLSISRLKRLGPTVVIATVVAAVLVLNGSRLIALALGWDVKQGLFLAGILMVSSSAIISKVLEELNQTHERAGQLALGVTVLEDVVAVAMLTLLSSLVPAGGGESAPLIGKLGALLAFVVFIALLSLLVVPNLLTRLRREGQTEIQTLLLTGLLLSLAWLAVRAGYSLALGAFVLGAIVGSTRHKADVEQTFVGVRDMFGAVFFVAVGMQVDFRLLGEAWPLVLLVTAITIVLRPIACAFGFIAVGQTTRNALRAGLILTPLGEFSFIIAQLGVATGAVPASFFPMAVGASLATSLLAPVLTRRADGVSERLARMEPTFLREWTGFYHSWLVRLGERRSASLLWRLTARRWIQVAVHILFVSALILMAAPVYERVKQWIGPQAAYGAALPFVFWTVFGLLVLAPLIAIWRNVSALAMILAESATKGTGPERRLRPLIEFALRAVSCGVLVVWLLALLPTGGSILGAAGAVLLVLLLVTVVFWRRFVRLHSRLEIELLEQLQQASRSTSTSNWSAVQPDAYRDWNLELDEVTLPGDSPRAGTSLGQLAIRSQFGCSVIGIDRQGFGISNPRAGTVLYPRDKLLLLGEKEQLESAARFLGASGSGPREGFDDLLMETLHVPAGSPFAGQTLIELRLIDRFGVQVGAIRRGKTRLVTPAGDERILVGDQLLMLGVAENLRAFATQLAPVVDGNSSDDATPTAG
jgi:CPA2 family monovalent cation:H+ antiporter-2